MSFFRADTTMTILLALLFLPLTHALTTLEQVFSRAFNQAVENGDWNRYFGSSSSRQASFCTGNPEAWPLPSPANSDDLQAMLDRQVFKCGFDSNLQFTDSATGSVLIESTNTSVSGSVVDWMDTVATYMGDFYDTALSVEWILYDSSQTVLEAVENGTIDAACGYWAPDGEYRRAGGRRVARGTVFSSHCPTLLQQDYLYVNDNSITSFEGLLEAMEFTDDDSLLNPNARSIVCVSVSPGGGLATTCQNLFDQYRNGTRCQGRGERSFQLLQNNNCIAVFSGTPPNGTTFGRIEQPLLLAPTTFFRKHNVNTTQQGAGRPTPTSLELQVTRAFNELIAKGVYEQTLGVLEDTQPLSFCTGGFEAWPEHAALPNSDLRKVITEGVFRCGYPSNLVYETQSGQVILDTTTPDAASGAIPDFWNLLLAQVGEYHNTSLTVDWLTFDASQDVLDALSNGTIDAACAYFNPDGTWTAPNDMVVARGYAFSNMYCPVFAQTDYIYVLSDTGITTFGLLVQAIDAGTVERICVEGSAGGGTEATCANTFQQYATQTVECVGGLGAAIFDLLVSGECDAVFSGFPPDNLNVNRIAQPIAYTPVTLFRTTELTFMTDMPTPSPTVYQTSVPTPSVLPPPSTPGTSESPTSSTPSAGGPSSSSSLADFTVSLMAVATVWSMLVL